jgi:hypothetical protein
MSSIKCVQWFRSFFKPSDIANELYVMYHNATKLLGESERYEVKMIVHKPEPNECPMNQEKLDFECEECDCKS